ncbi:MAG TPA: peptidoglycan editing factor PgeF [Casimicrobiaceae bacterium]|nr:peptidoglycan editing factor PgeF [Casimicrobiaceae bacterium]
MSARALARELAAAGLDWIVPEWDAPPNVHAFSTTRNLGTIRGGAADEALSSALARWAPSPPRWLRQVHGAAVHDADTASGAVSPPRADAIVARAPRVVCAIQTADCLPVLFTDGRGSAVGAAHAGWRGLAAGVIEATLASLRVPAHEVRAWIGPGIGPRAYEVGSDVLDAHCAADPGAASCFVPVAAGKWLADLAALARRRLERAGVASVAASAHCTFSESAVFHSYRRDGARAGRMVTLIWRTA